MNVPLKVIPRPKPKTRVQLTLPDGACGPILKGTVAAAPNYCCGGCGTVLVEGVPATQFVDARFPFHSNLEIWHIVALTVEEHVVKQTLPVKGESVITITKNGPLLLTCPTCHRINEMLAPNVVGPSQ